MFAKEDFYYLYYMLTLTYMHKCIIKNKYKKYAL